MNTESGWLGQPLRSFVLSNYTKFKNSAGVTPSFQRKLAILYCQMYDITNGKQARL